jgi:hypothetical protein
LYVLNPDVPETDASHHLLCYCFVDTIRYVLLTKLFCSGLRKARRKDFTSPLYEKLIYPYYYFTLWQKGLTFIRKYLARAMKPMIDMRGFPDTEGLCPNAGFFPNKTDCTQFYRWE